MAPNSIFRSDAYGFSQGVLVEEGKKTLFISGQLAADREGKFAGGTFREQCKMALDSLAKVLKEAGASKHHVVKITAYVTDMQASLEEFSAQIKTFFSEKDYPASTLVEVKGLAFPGQVVEIEAIAVL